MSQTPTEIRRNANQGLKISWPNAVAQDLSSEVLRRNCPCAECREARGEDTHSKPITGPKRSLKIIEHTADEQLNLVEIWGVGNYAIGIGWGDGHRTGIYTFDYLKSLGSQIP